jgi:hypothetical protein
MAAQSTSKSKRVATDDDDDNHERRALHAFLSDEAHESWHRVAAELGVSVSGMLEAMAFELEKPPKEGALGDRVDTLVKRARKIDAQRRRR